MNRPEYLLTIPADEYHAATKRNEYTSSHRLNLFRKCPALYKKTIDGLIVEGDTAAFQLGRATHTLILEGVDKFAEEFAVSDGPVNEKTGKPYGKATKAYLDWAAEQKRPVISTEDYRMMNDMFATVRSHPVAKDLLASGIAEGTIRTTWDGEPVQARLDWYDPERNILVDLKTCSDIDRFGYDIRDFQYVPQMAFYAKALMLSGAATPDVFLVAVEKKEPFRVSVTHISATTVEDAISHHMGGETWRDDCEAMLAELRKCRETGVWPTRYEGVVTI